MYEDYGVSTIEKKIVEAEKLILKSLTWLLEKVTSGRSAPLTPVVEEAGDYVTKDVTKINKMVINKTQEAEFISKLKKK